jgi:hypothetical protein
MMPSEGCPTLIVVSAERLEPDLQLAPDTFVGVPVATAQTLPHAGAAG